MGKAVSIIVSSRYSKFVDASRIPRSLTAYLLLIDIYISRSSLSKVIGESSTPRGFGDHRLQDSTWSGCPSKTRR